MYIKKKKNNLKEDILTMLRIDKLLKNSIKSIVSFRTLYLLSDGYFSSYIALIFIISFSSKLIKFFSKP